LGVVLSEIRILALGRSIYSQLRYLMGVLFPGSLYTRSEHAAKGQTREQQAKAYGRWWREPFQVSVGRTRC
jgi:hypothetical protein